MNAANRRVHPRLPSQAAIEVRDHPDSSRAIEVDGIAINVSRGGVLVVLKDAVSVGSTSDCLVRFRDEDGAILAPRFRWGVALRSRPVDEGYEVAIEFKHLLEPRLLDSLSSPIPFPG